jgi:hypothetical protein
MYAGNVIYESDVMYGLAYVRVARSANAESRFSVANAPSSMRGDVIYACGHPARRIRA